MQIEQVKDLEELQVEVNTVKLWVQFPNTGIGDVISGPEITQYPNIYFLFFQVRLPHNLVYKTLEKIM